ncbi:MAG: Rne/Rng family ribonuclease, partial [Pseudomonadota bacterium]
MAKKMLIDATHAEETRVVVVDGNRVDEFDFETVNKRQLAGNIYLAKVTRVEPSLQAAFVDYGGNRHGFLAFTEIHPDYYQIPVADREALIAEEREIARAQADEDDAPKKSSRRRRSSSKAQAAKETDAVETRDVPSTDIVDGAAEGASGMEVVDPLPDDAEVDLADGPLPAPGEAGFDAVEPEAPAAPEAVDAEPAAGAAEAQSTAEPEALADTADAAVPTDPPAAETAEVEAAETPDQAEPDSADATTEATPEAAGTGNGEPEAKTSEGEGAAASDPSGADEGSSAEEESGEEPYAAVDHATEIDSEIESVAVEDVHEEIRAPRKPRSRRYKIQEVIKVRQIMLVQVVKEERGNKGAALTTYLSLAGRYCVLMPNTARGGGISRKITNATDRKKLKEIAGEIEVPEGAGLIIRTAGAKRTKTEIKRDYEYLKRLWEQIRDLTLKSIAPAPIYEEGNLIKRSIRDLYSREIDEVWVEGDEGYRVAKDFMKMIMPSHAKNVKHYAEPMPLFARYQAESYLASMFNPTVQLKSGGYIVIGVTEALVAIDVNSGRATKKGSIEETALETNLEAAEEIARQLRLRDLAGLIVIDFIDMEERKNNAAVEKRFKDRLKNDRARIQVGRISGFGLLEMSRQRLRPGMLESTTQPCPHCHGTGLIRSDDSLGLQILRQLEEEGVRGRSKEVLVVCPVAIANFLMNQKRERIAQIEARYGLSVRLEGEVGMVSPDFRIEKFKTASRAVPEPVAPVISVDTSDLPDVEDEIEVEEVEAEAQERTEASEEAPPKKKRRRRRRRRSSGTSNGAVGEEQPVEAQAEEGSDDTGPSDGDDLSDEVPSGTEEVPSAAEADGEAETAPAASETSEAEETGAKSVRRSSRSRRRRTSKSEPVVAADAEEAVPGPEAAPEPVETTDPLAPAESEVPASAESDAAVADLEPEPAQPAPEVIPEPEPEAASDVLSEPSEVSEPAASEPEEPEPALIEAAEPPPAAEPASEPAPEPTPEPAPEPERAP